jgi:hypothetical protein
VHYFLCLVGSGAVSIKSTRGYITLVFLHPVGSVGHAVHSGYRFQKSNETHYTELMFLHPVGSAGSHSAFLVHPGTKRQRTIFHAMVGLVQIP